MKVALASDHGGFDQKAPLLEALRKAGFDVDDYGPGTAERCDYPDYASLVCEAIQRGDADCGLLICGTGIGMAIAANKYLGIRAAVVNNVDYARLAREHNDANALCLSGRFVDPETNFECAKVFLTTPFEGGRHAGRVAKIEAIERHEIARAAQAAHEAAGVAGSDSESARWTS